MTDAMILHRHAAPADMADTAPLVSFDTAEMTARFPDEPFRIGHALASHPLFTIPRLAELAATLPRDQVEMTEAAVTVETRFGDVKIIDAPADEVVRRIESGHAWMVLKRVERDPAYAALLREMLDAVARGAGFADCDEAGFYDLQGFVFVSSPRAVTPFHFDPEENMFVQIRGRKAFHQYDNRDRAILSDEELEISPSKHRNLSFDTAYDARKTSFHLVPGEGCFVPHLWPHWVETFDETSISMAFTWKSPAADRLNTLLQANGLLRHLGLPQASPGLRPGLDGAKVAGYRALRAAIAPMRRSEGLRRTLRGLLFGRQANYYYGKDDGAA
jgi:hypothetical protein